MERNEPDDRPTRTEAVEAAEQMNDPDGPQPGVVDNDEPDSQGGDGDDVPELMP